MFISIDGNMVPPNGRTNFTTAAFIQRHLRPDSVISFLDFEGTGYRPDYESLKLYADMILGNRVAPFTYRRFVHADIRRACLRLIGIEMLPFCADKFLHINRGPMFLVAEQSPAVKYVKDIKQYCASESKMFIIDSLMPSSDPLTDHFCGDTRTKLKDEDD